MSTITSLSFTFVNTYASQPAKPAAATERPASSEQAEKSSCGENRAAPRQNRLVEAMMSALRELGFGSPAAAPAADATPAAPAAATAATPAQSDVAVATNIATPAATATDAAAATATQATSATDSTTAVAATDSSAPAAVTDAAAKPAVSVEAAVHQFAHELFRALRQVGRGDSSDQESNRIDGDGGRRHHHGHNGWRSEGYGDMAQRQQPRPRRQPPQRKLPMPLPPPKRRHPLWPPARHRKPPRIRCWKPSRNSSAR